MLLRERHKIGDLKVVTYHFEKKFINLPHRKHNRFNEHITFVQRGKIKVYSHTWEMTAKAGQVLVFHPDEPHEIMSLEDDTKIMNILKYYDGKLNTPVEYEKLERFVQADD